MRKKGLMALAIALALVMAPAAVFAASSTSKSHSSSGGGGGGGSSSSSSGSVVSVGGVATSTTTTSGTVSSVTTSDGSTLSVIDSYATGSGDDYYIHALIVDTYNAFDQWVSNVGDGWGYVGDVNINAEIRDEHPGKMAGLPESDVNIINAVDAGDISSVAALLNPMNYRVISKSMAIIDEDQATGEVLEHSPVNLKIYCNQIPSEGTLAWLFYNNYSKSFEILPATSQNLEQQWVTGTFETSGTAWIICY
ncbi:MAG: hypothetical protein LUE86_12650 [Clostridiales bacterium]|nr:hypothetical protein [Clostridiales bacterium]